MLTASPTIWPSPSPPSTRTSPVSTPIRTSKWSPGYARAGLCDDVTAREGGPDRALRVVFVRDRRTEDGGEGPADERLDGAAEALELGAEARDERVENGLRLLRVERRLSVAGEVGKEGGHDLALLVPRPTRLVSRRGLESGVVIENLPLELPERRARLEPELLDEHGRVSL